MFYAKMGKFTDLCSVVRSSIFEDPFSKIEDPAARRKSLFYAKMYTFTGFCSVVRSSIFEDPFSKIEDPI